jgi:glycosyl hydrolase family 113
VPAALLAAFLAAPIQRGVALGLFSEDPDFRYERMLDEIAALGATDVSLVVPWYQHDVRSTRIERHPRFTPPDATVLRVLAGARQRGLRVLLYPILRLEYAATPLEWRGTLAPPHRAAWWRSYTAFVERMARLAASGQAASLAVGSELSNMDAEHDRWAALVARVRRRFRGTLLYSTNWDRLDGARVWDLVDLVGLSAYFELTTEPNPSPQRIVSAWREIRGRIEWRVARIGKPLVLTEVGYLSQQGTAARPWDEAAQNPIDLDEQRRCYAAFVQAWDGADVLQGAFFWNWYGWGGPKSREYTPRGKPAAQEICRWYGGRRCPSRWGVDWLR